MESKVNGNRGAGRRKIRWSDFIRKDMELEGLVAEDYYDDDDEMMMMMMMKCLLVAQELF
jgi:hypothetical protein